MVTALGQEAAPTVVRVRMREEALPLVLVQGQEAEQMVDRGRVPGLALLAEVVLVQEQGLEAEMAQTLVVVPTAGRERAQAVEQEADQV